MKYKEGQRKTVLKVKVIYFCALVKIVTAFPQIPIMGYTLFYSQFSAVLSEENGTQNNCWLFVAHRQKSLNIGENMLTQCVDLKLTYSTKRCWAPFKCQPHILTSKKSFCLPLKRHTAGLRVRSEK